MRRICIWYKNLTSEVRRKKTLRRLQKSFWLQLSSLSKSALAEYALFLHRKVDHASQGKNRDEQRYTSIFTLFSIIIAFNGILIAESKMKFKLDLYVYLHWSVLLLLLLGFCAFIFLIRWQTNQSFYSLSTKLQHLNRHRVATEQARISIWYESVNYEYNFEQNQNFKKKLRLIYLFIIFIIPLNFTSGVYYYYTSNQVIVEALPKETYMAGTNKTVKPTNSKPANKPQMPKEKPAIELRQVIESNTKLKPRI